MGISDIHLKPWYYECLKSLKSFVDVSNIAFFGCSNKDELCYKTEDLFCDFGKKVNVDLFDIQLGNWDINENNWDIEKYDLIVCLRTFYFSKDPKQTLMNFKKCLRPNGILFFDIGLGSAHFKRNNGNEGNDWTFGWEHEKDRCFGNYLGEKRYLYSSFWDDDVINYTNQFLVDFFDNAKKIDKYKNIQDSSLSEQIRREFEQDELIDFNDIGNLLGDIIGFSMMNTVKFNGRNAMYFLFAVTNKEE